LIHISNKAFLQDPSFPLHVVRKKREGPGYL
jgi:hypothetical protein